MPARPFAPTSPSLARLPWLGLTMAVACVLLQAGGEALVALLAWHREQPSLLTALSAQWVHWGWPHALGNAAVLLACGAYLEPRLGRGRLVGLVAATWLAGALCLQGVIGGLAEYRGASGISAAWLTLSLVIFSRVRSAWSRLAVGLASGLLFSLPAWLGVGSGVLPAGVRPVWELHLLAAVLAGAMAMWWLPAVASGSPLPRVGEGAGERER